MDPVWFVSTLAEKGPGAAIIGGLLYALRWAIQRGDAAQTAQILNGEKTIVALQASTKAVEDVTRILNDFKQAEAIREARQVARAEQIDRARGAA